MSYGVLVWEDNFEGSSLDKTKWACEVGDNWCNNELQAYTNGSTNVYLLNGFLVIQAIKESKGTRNYTSARLTTKGLAKFTQGHFEARIMLPGGKGCGQRSGCCRTQDGGQQEVRST